MQTCIFYGIEALKVHTFRATSDDHVVGRLQVLPRSAHPYSSAGRLDLPHIHTCKIAFISSWAPFFGVLPLILGVSNDDIHDY